MEKIILCKGGCGNKAIHKGWCDIKWRKGNKFGVSCPKIEEKRRDSISIYRLKEAKLGLNPMQNPKVCKKNHSKDRNKKASETLKKLGELRLLPQQTESKILRERRLKRIRKSLSNLAKKGLLNHQIEPEWKKKERHIKISKTLIKLAEQNKLPIQNLSESERLRKSIKQSKIMREKIKNGEFKLSLRSWGKTFAYKSLIGENVNLRSKMERDLAKVLDKNNLSWEYEPAHIPYYDSQKKQRRITIPDFFLKDFNIFIEVKPNEHFRSRNTRDKIKGLEKLGHKIILFGKKEIKLLRENPQIFLGGLKK